MGSQTNALEEILDKVAIIAVVSFLFTIYFCWSDSNIFKIVDYNANLAEEVGVFTRILAMIGGTLSGTIAGSISFLIKKIFIAVTSLSRDSGAYALFGWIFAILGLVGGTLLGVKFIILWMVL